MSDFKIPTTAEEWDAVKPTNEDCVAVEVWHRAVYGEEAYAPAVYGLAKLAAVARIAQHERCVRRLSDHIYDAHLSSDAPAVRRAYADAEARRILEDK